MEAEDFLNIDVGLFLKDAGITVASADRVVARPRPTKDTDGDAQPGLFNCFYRTSVRPKVSLRETVLLISCCNHFYLTRQSQVGWRGFQ